MALPDWLDPLYEADEMRAVDKWAIEEQGVPSLDLMERAGAGLARVAAGASREGPIRVVAGKGNNGGDGLVCARLLREDGLDVDVLALGELDEHRLMVARRGRRVDGDVAQARAQVAGREDEVARERVGPLVAIVHAQSRSCSPVIRSIQLLGRFNRRVFVSIAISPCLRRASTASRPGVAAHLAMRTIQFEQQRIV